MELPLSLVYVQVLLRVLKQRRFLLKQGLTACRVSREKHKDLRKILVGDETKVQHQLHPIELGDEGAGRELENLPVLEMCILF